MLWVWYLVVSSCQGIEVPLPEYNTEVSACVEAIVDRFLLSKCLAFLFPLDLENPSTVRVPAQVRSDLLKNLHLRVAPTLPTARPHTNELPIPSYTGALNRLRCAHVVILEEGKSYVEQINNVMYSSLYYQYMNGGGDETKMVVIGSGQIEDAEVHRLLHHMYTMGDVDVVFLGLRRSSIVMLTYFPFKNCPDESKSLEEIDLWVNGSFLLESNLFPNKIPLRFNNCPSNVSLVPYPPFVIVDENKKPHDGIDFRIIEIIGRHIEMNISFQVHDNWVTAKGEHRGAAVDVMLGRSLLVASGAYDLPFTYPYFSVVYSYLFSKAFWFFENPRAVPSWKLVFLPFSKTVWALGGTVAVLNRLCLFLLSNNRRKPRHFSRLAKSLLAPSDLPSDHSGSFRIVFGIWLFYVFHVHLAYTATLSCLLTTGKLEPKITSFEQISDRGIKTVLTIFFKYITTEIDEPAIMKVLSQSIVVADYDEILFQMKESGNFTILDEGIYFEYMVKLHKYDMYKSNLNIGLHSAGPIMRRNHFLAGRISDLSSRLFESGIVSNIIDNFTKFPEEKKNIKSSLTVKELVGPFCILAIGLFVSFLVFVGEVIISKINNKAIN